MTHPFTRLAEELRGVFPPDTPMTTGGLAATLQLLVERENAEALAKQDRVPAAAVEADRLRGEDPYLDEIQQDEPSPEEYAFPPTMAREDGPSLPEEPVESRLQRAYVNGFTSGLRLGADGRLDR